MSLPASTSFDLPSGSTNDRHSRRTPTRQNIKDEIAEVELENIKLDNKRIKLEIQKLSVEKQKLEAEKEVIEVKKALLIRQFEEQFPNSVVYTGVGSVSYEL